MRKLKITGDCFHSSLAALMNDTSGELVLVHGLPKGRSGDAAKAGRYPHAWVEIPSLGVVYDTVANATVPIERYYELGQIEFTRRYTMEDVRRLRRKYGPDTVLWNRTIKKRGKQLRHKRV